MLTAWLIRRRDNAADAWLRESTDAQARWVKSNAEQRTRCRLAAWDTLLGIWTRNGTRRC